MNKIKVVLIGALTILASLPLYGCDQGWNDCDHNGMMQGLNRQDMMSQGGMTGQWNHNMSMIRHRYVMTNGVPAAYLNENNRNANSTEGLPNQGKQLFQSNCSACHGLDGLGNGLAAASLSIKPTNIAHFSKMPMATDGYLLWTISEGGAPIGSAMPAFKTQLNKQQMWEIITYLRKL